MADASGKKRAWVWKHFVKSDTDETPVCKICSSQVKATSGNTTNLKNHLARKHPNVMSEEDELEAKKKNAKSAVVGSSSSSQQNPSLDSLWAKLGPNTKRHKDITLAIAKYIAIDLRPLNSVNDKGFNELIQTLEPRYQMTGRTHITEKILPDKYREIKREVKDALKSATFIGLTTDGWTSRATQSFITVTASVIDEDWKSKLYVLSTTELPESHTAENLSNQLDNVLLEWELEKEKVAVTTDNAFNVCSAMTLSNVNHVRCMAHTLNLGTQKCLNIAHISKLCGKVRRVVSYLHRSALAAALLKRTLQQLELPVLKPVIDVTTRWNSTLDMLERYLQIRPAISVVMANPMSKCQKDTVTEGEIAMIEEVIKVS